MGNCVQSSGGGVSSCAVAVEAGRQQQLLLLQRRKSAAGDEEEEVIIDQGAAAPSSVMKVKMVLTKGELGWLVAQLKAGDRRLEDVLQEMARKRDGRRSAAADGWRPSLESIVECPAETAAATSDD
ncbi:hypothetical protein BDA96_03G068300 [Sorghum bicolor]|uniref:Uncharacterized protein n=1 Tax=Sorghum bicolor TaxID=4558 RepID=A0A921RBE2_SORBI|nr:hypothetical protein BDA96_03G068300 [Sorghum bicolor]